MIQAHGLMKGRPGVVFGVTFDELRRLQAGDHLIWIPEDASSAALPVKIMAGRSDEIMIAMLTRDINVESAEAPAPKVKKPFWKKAAPMEMAWALFACAWAAALAWSIYKEAMQ